MAKIITANHLIGGDVVFLAENGWTPNVDRAVVANDAAALAALEARAAEAETLNIVVGPYPVEVRREGARIVPLHYREVMRTRGPTVRPDLGHQASLGAS
jgi:ABC-type nitrate/sulfonate/bicarbonate transport system substrate-binding protein